MKITQITTIFLFIFMLFSCSEDEQRSCLTCNSDLTTPFELCREGDGNASVNGENTGTPYETYIAGLEATGVSCSN